MADRYNGHFTNGIEAKPNDILFHPSYATNVHPTVVILNAEHDDKLIIRYQ